MLDGGDQPDGEFLMRLDEIRTTSTPSDRDAGSIISRLVPYKQMTYTFRPSGGRSEGHPHRISIRLSWYSSHSGMYLVNNPPFIRSKIMDEESLRRFLAGMIRSYGLPADETYEIVRHDDVLKNSKIFGRTDLNADEAVRVSRIMQTTPEVGMGYFLETTGELVAYTNVDMRTGGLMITYEMGGNYTHEFDGLGSNPMNYQRIGTYALSRRSHLLAVPYLINHGINDAMERVRHYVAKRTPSSSASTGTGPE